jgi:hypothetical protein
MFYAFKDEDGNLYAEEDLGSMYRDYLSDAYGVVSVAGLAYDVVEILEAVDPIAYRVGFADYTSEFEEVAFESFEDFEAAKDSE